MSLSPLGSISQPPAISSPMRVFAEKEGATTPRGDSVDLGGGDDGPSSAGEELARSLRNSDHQTTHSPLAPPSLSVNDDGTASVHESSQVGPPSLTDTESSTPQAASEMHGPRSESGGGEGPS
ncbi:MAG: hypothetical protein KC910_11155, partial [Candidatus Eremiobacteraeota bacterium]|nr:hypothetical protein [Candidatus Eremiobacteraeota bacterium]